MNLVIDIGNTLVKVALFEGDTIFYKESFDKIKLYFKLKKIHLEHNIDQAIISSVAYFDKNEINKIRKLFPLITLSHQTKIPFQNNYGSPKTLGVDRIALIASAFKKYPNQNVLVIDVGTCITFDFIDKNGKYRGGSISLGIAMRYQALHKFTNNLPLLKQEDTINLIGTTTEESIHNGVINGVVTEIDGIIDKYKIEYKKLTSILTGGDTNFLAKRLKNGIFANPNFLLEGLNNILTYNK